MKVGVATRRHHFVVIDEAPQDSGSLAFQLGQEK
jgi:hypothetical protein